MLSLATRFSLRNVVLGRVLAAAGGACSSDDSASSAEIEALIASGELDAAEAATRRRILEDPDDASLRLLMGNIHLATGDGAAAYAAFDKARTLGASGPELITGLARSLMLRGNYEELLGLLSSPDNSSSMPQALLELQLRAQLRDPLASHEDVDRDIRQLLTIDPLSAPAALEAMVEEPGVLPDNAARVRRMLAYWACQQTSGMDEILQPVDPPSWARLDVVGRRILAVGPAQELKTPAAAARVARDGDIIEIEAGTYKGDVASWRASGLWLRAKSGKVVLASGGQTAEDMGIWVIRGDNTVVEGIRFEAARATHRNGSGIRLLARNLWVRSAEFHDNENGILTYNQPGGEVRVEHSIFTENGASDGYSHNVYVGSTDRLVFRFNYSAGARIGHQLKSRAMENFILYNRLADESGGNSSYTIDLPEGGFALVMGNELQQGPGAVNKHMVSLGAEKPQGRDNRFVFAYNTFYNATMPATYIKDATGDGVTLLNNVFAGAPAAFDLSSPLRAGNAFNVSSGLREPREGDYGLTSSASFIDSGIDMDLLEDLAVVPTHEYRHPAAATNRKPVWLPDPGAHEFCGWPE